MSKVSKIVKANQTAEIKETPVTNFMGGTSYVLDPLSTLKLIASSSIFGEPAYYRQGIVDAKNRFDKNDDVFSPYNVITDLVDNKTTSQVMEEAIDNALSYDFAGTLEYAKYLRNDLYMRFNPQVIMVRAAMHPDRVKFNETHPGVFAAVNAAVMRRADEPSEQLAYYSYVNSKNYLSSKDSKKNLPNPLKKSWKQRLENASAYEINKYKNSGVGMINTVRVCHAGSREIDALMHDSMEMADSELTWENMRSARKTWTEILSTITLGHMALLRNLRNIFTEVSDIEMTKKILDQLKAGVKGGKQFPFRYYTAYKTLENEGSSFSVSELHHLPMLLDALEECIDIACDNVPHLTGKTMCLSDNSGSAWDTFNSAYGRTNIAEIDNLSSVITAHMSDEGYVGVFGDRLNIIPISHRNGVLKQTEEVTEIGNTVGMSTENGVWLFLESAINKKEHWDNIVIYSDMQAGRGELYGSSDSRKLYRKLGYACNLDYIDVAKLIDTYRREVNPKVNVLCVQTAGYNNMAIPEMGYRTTLTSGWTGKEHSFLVENSKFWDEQDAKH